MPARIAETVYQILIDYAHADPDYHEKEVFVFHFSIVNSAPDRFELSCLDGNRRIFHCSNDKRMWVEGKDSYRINPRLNSIRDEIYQEFTYRGFIVKRNAV